VLGNVMAGFGDAGKNTLLPFRLCADRIESWLTFVMRIASFGQAWTHAGGSSAARRWLHISHLRTMPRLAEYLGTS
jgi:hypothetical protein